MARSDKKNQHARIIWSCAWTGDDRFFATASRDKKVLDEIAVYFPSVFKVGKQGAINLHVDYLCHFPASSGGENFKDVCTQVHSG